MITEEILAQIALPLVFLVVLAWVVPRIIVRILPQRLWALWVNGLLSSALLILICATYLFWGWKIGGQSEILDAGTYMSIALLAVMRSLSASIVWMPVLCLALILEPQKWRPKL